MEPSGSFSSRGKGARSQEHRPPAPLASLVVEGALAGPVRLLAEVRGTERRKRALPPIPDARKQAESPGGAGRRG